MSNVDFNEDDIQETDFRHVISDTDKNGKPLAKEKYRKNVDDAPNERAGVEADTSGAFPTLARWQQRVADEQQGASDDASDLTGRNCTPATEAEAILEHDLPDDPDDRKKAMTEVEAPSLVRNVGDKDAREKRKADLRGAMKDFESAHGDDDGLRVASGFKSKAPEQQEATKQAPGEHGRYTESFHIRDQITRKALSKDRATNHRLLKTLHRLKDDLAEAGTNALGISVHAISKPTSDYQMQKDTHGRTVYEGAMTLDRRKVSNRPRTDGVVEAIHDGSVRKAKNYGEVSHQDDLLPFKVVDAKNRLEEVEAGLGPLWRVLCFALRNNSTLAAIGEDFGKTGPQASAVGTVLIGMALRAASNLYDRMDDSEASEAPYIDWLNGQPDAMAIPARRLKRALNPGKSASLVFRNNRATKSMLSAANDNHSAGLNEAAA